MIADYAPALLAPREGVRRLRRSLLIGCLLATGAAVALGGVAQGGSRTGAETVVVHPGDTLWAIAASRFPQDNVADRVQEIVSLNGLASPVVDAGKVLVLPTP